MLSRTESSRKGNLSTFMQSVKPVNQIHKYFVNFTQRVYDEISELHVFPGKGHCGGGLSVKRLMSQVNIPILDIG